MVQGLGWETNRHSNTPKITLILWNPEVGALFIRVSTLSQTLLVHTMVPYVFKQTREKGDSKKREANKEKVNWVSKTVSWNQRR